MENQKLDLSRIPIFRTGLFIPEYKEGEIGNWRIQKSRFRYDYGYVSGVTFVEEMTILSQRCKEDPEKWEVWMSIAPYEIESQELCCRNAYGHTVVMGLGLGWISINTAMNDRVKKVTVIEIDPEVIRLFDYSEALYRLPPEIYHKIEVVEGDARFWRSNRRKPDFLFVDIWRTMAEHSVLEDLRSMQNNLSPDLIYYWGQELTIYTQLQNAGYSNKQINEKSIRYCIEHLIKLPLLIPADINYSEMIMKAIKQRQMRGLPLFR